MLCQYADYVQFLEEMSLSYVRRNQQLFYDSDELLRCFFVTSASSYIGDEH